MYQLRKAGFSASALKLAAPSVYELKDRLELKHFFEFFSRVFCKLFALVRKTAIRKFENDSQRRCRRFCQKIEIGAILAIFQPYEVSFFMFFKI